MNALANLLKHETPAETDPAKIEEALTDTVPAMTELTEEQKLYQELDVACNGRLESEIPLSDDYWDVKRAVTRKLHELKHGA